MKCKKCGHQNPNGARYCGYCQQELEQKQGGALFKKYGILIVSCVAVLCVMIIILIQKDESPAQVTEPVGVTGTEETVHIHTWTDATCTAYATCTGCGITNGFKLSHKWTEGTCLEPGVCEVCGTVSTLPAHQWRKGMPKTCKLCGKVWASTTNAEGETLLDATVDSVIRERLPIATYAMADVEKVYSYSDATLTEQTKQYYFNSQTDEIVILDISEDGSAMYVRYPSTISGNGYRDRWFASEDILGELEPAVSEYIADTKIKTYKWLYGSLDIELSIYDMIPAGTKITSLGEHIYDELIVYSLPKLEWILNTVVTERMALTSPYDKPNELVADGYKTFLDYLDYDYVRPDRVLTKSWADGGIKIEFLSRRELYFELTDSYMSGYPSTSNSVPLTSVLFSVDQNDLTGFTIMFSMQDQLQFEIYFTNAEGKKVQALSYSDVQGYYSNGCVTMYLALKENSPWDVYDLTSISVETHQNETVPEEHIVTQGNKTVEIHCDSIRKIQSVQEFFTALDAQGNVLWTYVTQERQDRGQMSGIRYMGYINDIFLFDDNGTIVALDAETGKQHWKKSDFGAVLGPWDVNADGSIFLAGIYEPDLFVLNEDGKLLKKIKSISEEYPYATKIRAKQDHLIVGVNNYWDGWVQQYRIDLDDYSCTLLEDE